MNRSQTEKKPRQAGAKRVPKTSGVLLSFENNELLKELFGAHDQHLALVEDRLDITAHPKGNQIVLKGSAAGCKNAERVLKSLYQRLEEGLDVAPGDVDGAIRLATSDGGFEHDDLISDLRIATKRRVISPRSKVQAIYIDALARYELVFATGPAGTGKTYLAVAAAVAALGRGEVDRIVLSRPAVEAGEHLGFLPGDMRDKVDPYLRPLYDALYDLMPGNQVTRGLEDGSIEIAPLAFMRGRTLAHAFIILDEAQNSTPVQMKMFLTRLGENSAMVATGDPSQIDLPADAVSGLNDAADLLADVKGVTHIKFSDKDVVRHPLVSRIVRAYDDRGDAKQGKKRR